MTPSSRHLDAPAVRAAVRRRRPGDRLDLRGVVLEGLDLTGIELDHVDLAGSDLRDVALTSARLHDVDLTGANLRDVRLDGAELDEVDLRGAHLCDVVFGRRTGARPASLVDVGFEDCRLEATSFSRCRLDRCRLQDAHLDRCDLRYAEVLATSFKGARLLRCDLYRSHLGPRTVFERADLSDCSLYLATFEGVVVPRSAITGGHRAGLLQERPRALADLHGELVERGEMAEATGDLHRATAQLEAADVYRRLSAHWAGTGATRDAAWAYQRAKALETRSWRPDHVRARRRAGEHLPVLRPFARWLAGLLAGALAGHGERPLRVLGASVAWTVLLAVVFRVVVPAAAGVDDAALLALQAVTTTAPVERLDRAGQVVVSVGAAGGVTLLGLFGFTLGNRLRHA